MQWMLIELEWPKLVLREKVKIFDNEKKKKSENRFCDWLQPSVISDWKK